jgi:peptidoglycan/LPS O-acetylase OafA/YrhL
MQQSEAYHHHDNNFGFLRLLLASLVILSHSPELIDGDRSNELLTLVFGTLSLGELAVDGFFLISGFLITKSFENSRTIISYLRKRVVRIYPAFLVAYFVSFCIVGPLSGASLRSLTGFDWLRVVVAAVLLQPPHLTGAFEGMHYPLLNGAMWTISYEFRCYLLVVVLGVLGVYRRPLWLIVITLVLLALLCLDIRIPVGPITRIAVGEPHETIRLTAMFCVGSLFYIFQRAVPLRLAYVYAAAISMTVLLSYQPLAEGSLAIIGGYLIFWVALHAKIGLLAQVNSSTDISYGVYLYGWPIQNSLIYYFRDISPWTLTLATLGMATILGFLSWRWVESPFLAPRKGRASANTLLSGHSKSS